MNNVTADPDKACEHLNFDVLVEVHRMTPEESLVVEGYAADITISCRDCGEPFRFIGAPAGAMPDRPCVSVDETELRAPIRPASSDPDFGLGIPGFAVQVFELPEQDRG